MRRPTPYGKKVRIERLKKEIIANDMAKFLGVTPSFLSSVELGRKKVPSAWHSKLKEILALNDVEHSRLLKLVEQSNRIVTASNSVEQSESTVVAPKLKGSDE